MKYKATIIVVLVLILLFTSTTFAESNNYNSLSRAIRDNSNISTYVGGDNSIIKFSRDIMEIGRYITMTALLISLFALFLDFRMAADAPEVKARIKSKALWRTMGIIFCLNFWAIYGEASKIASQLFR